jgi:cell division septum initiation protein DivIVA
MAYTPVELRHVRIGRRPLGYNRDAVEHLLEDVADSFETVWRERGELEDRVETLEKDLAELRRREELLAQALVAAEQAASETRAQAKREADTIVGEAHREARSIVRGAHAEQARLVGDTRRIEGLMRAALGIVEGAGRAPEALDEAPVASPPEGWPRRGDTAEFPPGVHPIPAPEVGHEPEQEAQAG